MDCRCQTWCVRIVSGKDMCGLLRRWSIHCRAHLGNQCVNIALNGPLTHRWSKRQVQCQFFVLTKDFLILSIAVAFSWLRTRISSFSNSFSSLYLVVFSLALSTDSISRPNRLIHASRRVSKTWTRKKQLSLSLSQFVLDTMENVL